MKLHLKNDLAVNRHPLMNKLSLLLIGVFLSCAIFALLIQNLATAGLWLSLLLQAALIFCGFYYIEKHSPLRLINWGLLATVIALVLIFALGINLLPLNL